MSTVYGYVTNFNDLCSSLFMDSRAVLRGGQVGELGITALLQSEVCPLTDPLNKMN